RSVLYVLRLDRTLKSPLWHGAGAVLSRACRGHDIRGRQRVTATSQPQTETARPSFAETLAVYLKPRVLIVLFLGFSAGLPLALSGSTLRLWMRQSGIDLETIGLFALVGTPYTIKFLWAPVVDALDVPVFSRLLGRRRGWLVFSQLVMI